MHVLSVSQERELRKGIKVVNGNYLNAQVLAELADRYERLKKRAESMGLYLTRKTSSPNATLYHCERDNQTNLIENAPIEAIERALPRIHRIEAEGANPVRYALLDDSVVEWAEKQMVAVVDIDVEET